MKEEKTVVLHLRDFLYYLKDKQKFIICLLSIGLLLTITLIKINKKKTSTQQTFSGAYKRITFLNDYLQKQDAYIASFVDNGFQNENIYTNVLIYNLSGSTTNLVSLYSNTLLNQKLFTNISKKLKVSPAFAYDLVSVTAYPFGNNALNFQSDLLNKDNKMFVTLRSNNLDNLNYLRKLLVEEVKVASTKLTKIYDHKLELVNENILNGPNQYLSERINNEIKQYKTNKDNYTQLYRLLTSKEKDLISGKGVNLKSIFKKAIFAFSLPLILGILYQLYIYLYDKKVNNVYEFNDRYNCKSILLTNNLTNKLRKRYPTLTLLNKDKSLEIILNNILTANPATKIIIYTGSNIDEEYATQFKKLAKKEKIKVLIGNNFKENNDLLKIYPKCDFVIIEENTHNKYLINEQIKTFSDKEKVLLLNI